MLIAAPTQAAVSRVQGQVLGKNPFQVEVPHTRGLLESISSSVQPANGQNPAMVAWYMPQVKLLFNNNVARRRLGIQMLKSKISRRSCAAIMAASKILRVLYWLKGTHTSPSSSPGFCKRPWATERSVADAIVLHNKDSSAAMALPPVGTGFRPQVPCHAMQRHCNLSTRRTPPVANATQLGMPAPARTC
jgi:hypothetical protein